MSLDAPTIERLTPGKHHDRAGLFLIITPNGTRSWRYRYRMKLSTGRVRERVIVLGHHPTMSLTQAREARDREHDNLKAGIDPVREKHRQQRAAAKAVIADQDSTFKAVALEWFKIARHDWRDSYADTVKARLERHLFPALGRLSMKELEAPTIVKALQEIQDEGAGPIEVAHRCKRYITSIGQYAVAKGYITSNPARDIGREALIKARKTQNRPAIIDPKEFGFLLEKIANYQGRDVLRLALQIIALTVPRPGELRKALWRHVNLSSGEWLIPADVAKEGRDHLIPLSRQAVKLFKELRAITYHDDDDAPCFPIVDEQFRGKTISENALAVALAALGYPGKVHCPHGFRSSFSTMARRFQFCSIIVSERCLAHITGGDVQRRYDRYDYIDEKRAAMQEWADRCDILRRSATLLGELA